MKTSRIVITIGSLFYLLYSAPTAFAQTDLPAGASKNWYARQTAAIDDIQYGFIPSINNEFTVHNPAHRLGFTITPSGYTAFGEYTTSATEKWHADFTIQRPGSIVRVIKNGTSIHYRSPLMDIDYINNVNGLRQNFIVHKKMPGTQALSITIKVNTELHTTVMNSQQLILSDPKNKKDIKLVYDQLKVWDSQGRALPAIMKFNHHTKLLSIIVDDRHAVYPVTIDPLNNTPEWTTSANGILPGLLNNLQLQVQTAYGYTVAGLGDINGDGYDDVAVSAPTMADVVTGSGSLTGVGAVFIYLGSAAGLSTVPDKILQPTTPVAGSLFGLSIAAGDITGDGKNDIIIGAPLDTYQTTASSLFGPTSVNVKAGRVYVYRSEDLFTAPVPAPFLQIRLQGSAFFSTGIAGLLLSNVNVNPLFGYSIAVTKDLNGDGKGDLVIGSPAYMGVNLLSVQSGAAFVYYSNNLSTTVPAQLNTPTPSLLGIASLPLLGTNGLLFGFSVDGVGDFNNDGYADLVVGAPAGINLNSLAGIFTGQFLGGSAYIFYGTGSGVQLTSTVRLEGASGGLLSNTANLFGYKVKGTKNAAGVASGNVLIGAPAASVLSNIVGGLQIKAGELHVFRSKSPAASGAFVSDQVIASPRSSSILSILAGQTIQASLLYGASIDNMLDVNCDNIGDIIVGEPLSTTIPVLGADIAGGAAYVYIGRADGTYDPAPHWTLNTVVTPLLGVNATALLGFSVAGAGYTMGHAKGVRAIVGGPANALDFGSGLLNLGNTLSTTLNFVFDNNGLGKAYGFGFTNCMLLPVKISRFTAEPVNARVLIQWVSETEENLNYYELQRSPDGINFENIAMVFKKEPASDDYSFPDKKPFVLNYYRLKMVDMDGKISYSGIISVSFKTNASATISIAPNPVQATFQVTMNGLQQGNYRIELHNASGQVLMNKIINVKQPIQFETFPRQNMAAGIYWINVYNTINTRINSIKVMLQ